MLNSQVHSTALKLPSGATVSVPTCRVDFKPWTRKDENGRLVTASLESIDTFNDKPVLDHEGEPVFAELAILRLLAADGWDGRWVDSYRRQFRTGLLEKPPRALPFAPDILFRRIVTAKGSRGGCWDVFAWRGNEILFVEAKRNKKDHIRRSQKEWLEAATKVGLSLANFLIVEWNVAVEGVV